MDAWQAQYNFWSSFGVPAYEENSVPDEDELKQAGITDYITYQGALGEFDTNSLVSASIYTRSSSWVRADELTAAVFERLGGRSGGGLPIPYDGGGLWITKEDNFAKPMGDPEDDLIKRKLLSVVLRFC